MSDPAYINAGIGEDVGTATIDTSGVFTITDHGLDDGQPVRLDTLTGGASAVFRAEVTYFVRDVTTDTFTLESVPGDEVIELGSSGGADVHTAVPYYTAMVRRQLDAGLLLNDTDDRFGARAGIYPSSAPAVTLAGTVWTVENITGVVYPGITSTSGPYRFAHPAESDNIPQADPSQPRRDALYLQIQDDDEDNLGNRQAVAVYATGPADGSQDLPDQEIEAPNSLILTPGGILVPAGGSPSPSIQDPPTRRTVAPGGTLPVFDGAEGPDNPYHGQMRYRQDTDTMEVWNEPAAEWQVIARPNAPAKGWTPIANGTHSGGLFQIDVTDGGRYPAGTFSMMRLYMYGDLDDDGTVRLHINGPETAGEHQSILNTLDGASGPGTPIHATGTQWYLADWATVTGCTADVHLMNTDVSDATAFTCIGGRPSPTASAMKTSLASGRLTANHLVEILEPRPFTNGSNLFAELNWRLEGYRE